ncbi:hypothetical protein GPJ56_000696 [Histomonas meleagridis]|uniref:uncharacterized protein n=1 Tax=Histomonas meleagridis TaxID=135588 RepID=UPI00355A5AD5|nr:hypothetical protein GPJ56_000696 [Histomonas meleagridis]KAH0805713.1 hypothetical protein GO595_001488 [Histomonas meleagridis]
MGLGKIFGGIRKLVQGGGRLVENIIDKGIKIYGKISPLVKKGSEIISKIPGAIDGFRGKKDKVERGIDQIVDMVSDSKFKNKIRGAVDRDKQIVDRVVGTLQPNGRI